MRLPICVASRAERVSATAIPLEVSFPTEMRRYLAVSSDAAATGSVLFFIVLYSRLFSILQRRHAVAFPKGADEVLALVVAAFRRNLLDSFFSVG